MGAARGLARGGRRPSTLARVPVWANPAVNRIPNDREHEIRSVMKHRKTTTFGSLLAGSVLLALLCFPAPGSGQAVDPTALSSLRLRSLGPPGVSGDVTTVDVDLAVPFHVFAALEGRGSWVGPSDLWREGGEWDAGGARIDRGDGTAVLADPEDPRFVYSVTGAGDVRRHDRRTGEQKGVAPWAPRGEELRFGEETSLVFDPFGSELLYLGSQFVHRTPDRGTTWQIISGDLTGGGASGSISSIAPSPVEEEVLWVGTQDGRLHLTRSSGGTWRELTADLPGAGAGRARIAHIEASRHHGGTAFVSVDRRRSGDRGSHLYRTGDHGDDWETLGDDGGLRGVVNVIEQDPVAPELLFAGTTRGLYVSLSAGRRWLPWPSESGLPAVSIRSLLVHARDYDLVVGTAGRGLYVLDDVRPLRALARRPELLDQPLHLFGPPPAYVHHRPEHRERSVATESRVRGEGRPYGALLTYFVGAEAAGDSLWLEVVDDEDEVVHRTQVPGDPGVGRVAWNLGVDLPNSGAAAGAGAERPLLQALPGRYSVRLRSSAGEMEEASLRVLPDPRSDLSTEDRRAGHEAVLRAWGLLGIPFEAVERLDRVEGAVDRALDRVSSRAGSEADTLRQRGRRLRERARELKEEARGTVRDTRLLETLSGSFGAPTEAQRIALQELEDELGGLAGRVNDFLLGRISLYNDRLRAAGLEGLPDFEEIGR